MRLGFGLHMQQTQKLIMTPELRQAIAVLQLPVTELGDFIEQELLENPCLEVEPKEEAEDPTHGVEVRKFLEYLGNDYTGNGSHAESEDEVTFEAFTATVPTLQEHLMAQLYMAGLNAALRRTGAFLIDSLDDHGYLTIELSEAASRLSIPLEQAEQALQAIQGFDPPGVGARTLQECLLLQWATVDDGNPLVTALIQNYLDALGEGRIMRVAEELGVTPAEVQEAADTIRTLDPKPGRRFGRPDETRYVVPDVAVERVGHEYVVLVNEAPVPKLLVSNHYRQLLSGQVEAEARKFVEQKIHSALWLIKALEQRRMTLYKVTEAVVRFQRDFFDRGIRCLRPLTLREVADVVGVHESTVSRATSGKYVQTPHGTFELKFFFSSGVDNARGEGVAQESVKRMIADLIAKEDSAEPLSDQGLTDLLNRQGVNISRRTVAKYREEMGVPSSGKRKRYK
ncbi:MAG TPA: RNA polymerase factor sigma-54 [Symbiobacteriaceae bacterium]|nr:RNA polymerase factor sigma-54 [Symbiobacteriaceae bacterium]